MQMLFQLLSKLAMIAFSAPVIYYGYFLTDNIIIPNYLELLERNIIEQQEITEKI